MAVGALNKILLQLIEICFQMLIDSVQNDHITAYTAIMAVPVSSEEIVYNRRYVFQYYLWAEKSFSQYNHILAIIATYISFHFIYIIDFLTW